MHCNDTFPAAVAALSVLLRKVMTMEQTSSKMSRDCMRETEEDQEKETEDLPIWLHNDKEEGRDLNQPHRNGGQLD